MRVSRANWSSSSAIGDDRLRIIPFGVSLGRKLGAYEGVESLLINIFWCLAIYYLVQKLSCILSWISSMYISWRDSSWLAWELYQIFAGVIPTVTSKQKLFGEHFTVRAWMEASFWRCCRGIIIRRHSVVVLIAVFWQVWSLLHCASLVLGEINFYLEHKSSMSVPDVTIEQSLA